jgi:uncharacterized protein (TIGR00369 family)
MIATFTPRDPGFEVGVRRSFSRLALMSTIAARLTRIVPGEVEIDMPVRDDLTQQHGFVAAGIVTAIIDTACGYAAMSLMPAGHTVVTVEYKVNFVAPARGERLVARGRVVKPGRALTVCAGEVHALTPSGEKPVATMLGTMMALKDRPEVAERAVGATTVQAWDPDRYARNARYVADLADSAVELLAVQPGERILDLGCGDGALTERLVRLGGDVVGVDASPEQVAAARRRGVDARAMDGRQLDFRDEFDAVFSNMALHWMVPVDEVIAGVCRALRRGGRFVGEFGGHGCIAAIVAAIYAALARRGLDGRAVNPWHFPGADDYAGRLSAHGLRVDFVALVRRPTILPGDFSGFMETFGDAFTRAVETSERQAFVDEIRESLRPTLFDPARGWIADYVVLRFAAGKS